MTSIIAAVALVATIELLRLLRCPTGLQIVLAAAASCAVNAIFWRPMGLVVAPLFLLSGFAYLRWRPDSWLAALGYTMLIFFFEALPSTVSVFAHVTRNA